MRLELNWARYFCLSKLCSIFRSHQWPYRFCLHNRQLFARLRRVVWVWLWVLEFVCSSRCFLCSCFQDLLWVFWYQFRTGFFRHRICFEVLWFIFQIGIVFDFQSSFWVLQVHCFWIFPWPRVWLSSFGFQFSLNWLVFSFQSCLCAWIGFDQGLFDTWFGGLSQFHSIFFCILQVLPKR